ncbi:HAMP domain-containing histidine kinase [Crassaminicella thermophila]|uniref:histidine kinase n=1 Tax=Crassaminicella thermophila TaxID=2599308 RepID=A0A5C0SBA3_CRATE|nr:HAMP domain-containing sensor histidine kinase [Crassaminicella thermophila]QEK11833.1 HAMP domain-containing histidine kinase [Crassaminicella thermophila]
MKWRLTLRFVFTVISVVIIVIIINIVSIIALFIGNTINNQDNKLLEQLGPEDFVRNFHSYVVSSGKNVYVSYEGKKVLDRKKTWIQILDENGKEVYSYKRPENAFTKYTPFQIVNGYKYRGGIGAPSTIFIGEKTIGDIQYTYIIGFPMQKVDKKVLTYNIDEMRIFIKKITIIVLVIDAIIALFFGYLFSRRLTKPLGDIISGVEKLGEGEYDIYYAPKGVYSDVYHNLNILSDILKSNKRERMKLDKMREDWIANISHDIKTPLASIKGYAEILSDDDYEFSNEEIKAYAEIIHQKANYIKELVDDLNLATKLKNKTSIINKKEINLVKLVRETIIDLLNDPNYSDRNIHFISVENIILKEIDGILIKRVISNLLYNALIHNDAKVKIEVKLIKDEKVHIFVKDNGKGIKSEELKYIFDRYYRGTNTGKRHKGSGLGMAIAKEIVKAHGGDIKIRSILGEGTEIEVIL